MIHSLKEALVEPSIEIPTGTVDLHGDLAIPAGANSIVVFAHGSGSSRHSPRNRFVAEQLQGAGLATLLFDLLTTEEEKVDARTREYRFDIQLLARRLIQVLEWLGDLDATRHLDAGCFGASTGAAAALVAAAERPRVVSAVVSRGGRPDLAGAALARVVAPTLLIVGGRDDAVIVMNREAMERMPAETPKRLEIVPGATHLFSEEGALEKVAELAAAWFTERLGN